MKSSRTKGRGLALISKLDCQRPDLVFETRDACDVVVVVAKHLTS